MQVIIRNNGPLSIPANSTVPYSVFIGNDINNLTGALSTDLASGATTLRTIANADALPDLPQVLGPVDVCVVTRLSADTNIVNDTICNTFSITGFKLSNFSPSGGYIGTEVTINGLGFSTTPSDHTVKFNGVVAQVSASTATTLTVTVPSGATSGKVSVTLNGTTKESASNFLVIPNAASVENVENAEEIAMFYNNGVLKVNDVNLSGESVVITNVAGQHSETYVVDAQGAVDVSELESGIYVAILKDATLKFVVE